MELGRILKWNTLTLLTRARQKQMKKSHSDKINYGKVFYPFGAYGEALPEATKLKDVIKEKWRNYKNRYDAILIKNATVWTNESDSILKDHDVYMVEGKIVRIAPNIHATNSAHSQKPLMVKACT
jgi:hypothetical protein